MGSQHIWIIFYFENLNEKRIYHTLISSFHNNFKPNQSNVLKFCTWCLVYSFLCLFFLIYFVLYWSRKYSVNIIRMGGGKSQTLIKCLLSGCRLWIWVLIWQLPHFFHPSTSPSISSLFWRYHPSSCSYQFISSHISLLISPPHPSSSVISTCQSVCLSACVSVHEKISVWPVVRGKDCLHYKLLLRDSKWQIVKVNECVCICVHALSCLRSDIFSFSVSQEACLFKYLFPSLYLSLGPICSLRAASVVNITRQTSWVELWLEGRTHGG